jgi:integrase
MTKTITPYLKKVKPTDKEGYINIRITENRKSTYESIGWKIKEKYWDVKSKRVKSTHKAEFEEINKQIEDKIIEIKGKNNPNDLKKTKSKSIVHYWQDIYINIIKEHYPSTKQKHQNVLNKFLHFLHETYGQKDLLFKDLTNTVLHEFVNYMKVAHKNLNEKGGKRKSMGTNTTIHYIKLLHGVINMADQTNVYKYLHDPFKGLGLKSVPTIKNALSIDELTRIVETDVPEDLQLTKQRFLFQVFSQGMRSSDIQLLKWEFIQTERITYDMKKREKQMYIPLNVVLLDILLQLLNVDFKNLELNSRLNLQQVIKLTPAEVEVENRIESGKENKLFKEYAAKVKKTQDKASYLSFAQFKINFGNDVPVLIFAITRHNKKYYLEYLTNIGLDELKKELALLSFTVDRKGENLLDFTNELSNDFINKIKDEFIPLINKAIETLSINIQQLKLAILDDKIKRKDYENKFILKFFCEDLEEPKLTKQSNLNTIIYNRKLKQLQKICEIKTPISSHVARHTYASILYNVYNLGIYDLMRNLGHATVATTEQYLKGGFTNYHIDGFKNPFANDFKL